MSITIPQQYEYRYGPVSIQYGTEAITALGELLAEKAVERAMIVTGKNVGSNQTVMEPIRASIGDRLVTVFDETTPKKDGETVVRGVEKMREHAVDGIVVVGSGSSIDVARAMCVVEAEGTTRGLFSTHTADGGVDLPTLPAEKQPIFAVPTTFAGSSLTCASGVNFRTVREGEVPENSRSGPIYDPNVLPTAVFYNPEFYATTPKAVLAASGMNGFDHGLEMLYSRNSNPITDAVARHGLTLLRSSLPRAVSDSPDEKYIGRTINGVMLCSFGLIDPEAQANKYNIIHAVGHIVSRYYDIQQGAVHGIVAPAVLEHIFAHVDGHRQLLADALVTTPPDEYDDAAPAVVEAVREMRNGLGLPRRLNEVVEIDREYLPQLAQEISEDVGVMNGPRGVPTSPEDFENILETVL